VRGEKAKEWKNRSKQDGTGLILEEQKERKDYSY
jgi:hypothetical protein